ncbi:hypothetical protein [Pedobacter sp. JCM 36344]|uniref:hypothetical protein n=1 Tax=Pedobacter sp. JCM 36344 TaxID=3374280 RepID=UPI003979D9C3
MLIYKKLLCNWMGLVLLALGCLFYLSYGYLKASEQKKSLVIHAYKVFIHTSKLKFQLQELELSFHYYTLTGDPKYKRRLKRSAALAEAELAMFRRLTLHNIGMRPLSESIKLELDERIKFYKDNMHLPASAVQTAWLKNVVLPDINAKCDQIEEAELRLLHSRQAQAERSAANFAFLFCAFATFALLILAYLYYGSRLASKKSDLLTVEIAESKSAYGVLFDRIGDVLFTRDVNKNTFLEISNTCEAIFGYCASDFIEQKFLWLKITHPADRHMLNVGQRRLKKGESHIKLF